MSSTPNQTTLQLWFTIYERYLFAFSNLFLLIAGRFSFIIVYHFKLYKPAINIVPNGDFFTNTYFKLSNDSNFR